MRDFGTKSEAPCGVFSKYFLTCSRLSSSTKIAGAAYHVFKKILDVLIMVKWLPLFFDFFFPQPECPKRLKEQFIG